MMKEARGGFKKEKIKEEEREIEGVVREIQKEMM
jgi:hypothetical protein